MIRRLINKIILGWFLLLAVNFNAAASENNDDKTLSPYFFVKSDNTVTDQLPLKSTKSEVNIAGVIADVKVTQVYKNEGKQPLEAIYVFPAATRAAVHGMKMTIGERTIIAKIQEKQKARQEYEQAKQEGKSASLLEQQRPNVFQMNVANVMPGDLINVELNYTELLIPTDGVYEFVYPAVVGPRYSNQPEASANANEKWIKNPYLHAGEAPPYEFGVTTKIAANLPLQDITCSSHKVNINFENAGTANIQLDPNEKTGGNRDYILKYRLSGGKIESGLLLYQGEKENFFLLMMQPPQNISNSLIPAREYIFIVDVSGSMHGFPLDISKKLLKDLISALKPNDNFNVLLFSGSAAMLAEQSLPATPANINKALNVINNQIGGGGTELLPALRQALALPIDEKRSRSIIIATDGYVSVEKETFDLIRQNLGQANVFSFGIGSSVNRFLMEGIARAGFGEPFIITKPEEAPAIAEKFRKYIQSPVLTKIKVNFGEFATYAVEPSTIPDIFAERPVIIFGKWKGNPQGIIHLEGISGNNNYQTNLDVATVKPDAGNSALRYLWARNQIAVLGDYNQLTHDAEQIKKITQLGLDYNLLTDFTSFIAIDSLKRNLDGKATTVNQPLPLPEGVSDLAVGGASSSRAIRAFGANNAEFQVQQEIRVPPVSKFKAELSSPKELNTVVTGDVINAASPSREAERLELKKIAKPSPQIKQEEFKTDSTTSKDEQEQYIINCIDAKIISGNFSKIVKSKLLSRCEIIKAFEIESCYRYRTEKTSDHGKFVMKFEIDGNGKVIKVDTDLANQSWSTCVIKTAQNWVFPAPSDGKTAEIQFTFRF